MEIIKIQKRETIEKKFFEAVDDLIAKNKIADYSELARLLNTNKVNISLLRKGSAKLVVRPEWIAYLYLNYNISPLYILAEEGKMYFSGKA